MYHGISPWKTHHLGEYVWFTCSKHRSLTQIQVYEWGIPGISYIVPLVFGGNGETMIGEIVGEIHPLKQEVFKEEHPS